MTLRQALHRAGFNWKASGARIVWHDHRDTWDLDQEDSWDSSGSPGWQERSGLPVLISGPWDNWTHWVLDQEYDAGYGGPECPRFVAEDDEYIYMPEQYDGSTAVFRVAKNLDVYLSEDAPETPYPGG